MTFFITERKWLFNRGRYGLGPLGPRPRRWPENPSIPFVIFLCPSKVYKEWPQSPAGPRRLRAQQQSARLGFLIRLKIDGIWVFKRPPKIPKKEPKVSPWKWIRPLIQRSKGACSVVQQSPASVSLRWANFLARSELGCSLLLPLTTSV